MDSFVLHFSYVVVLVAKARLPKNKTHDDSSRSLSLSLSLLNDDECVLKSQHKGEHKRDDDFDAPLLQRGFLEDFCVPTTTNKREIKKTTDDQKTTTTPTTTPKATHHVS